MIDVSNMPAGGPVVAIIAYCLVATFVTGPVVATRTIQSSGWETNCQTALAVEIEESATPDLQLGDVGCNTLFGMLGDRGAALCRVHGEKINNLPPLQMVRELEARKAELERRRMDRAIAKSGSRCSCAENLISEGRRLQWALHAGSARLITPTPIRNLEAELAAALHSPSCSLKG
ncbi:MAG: hypothetical protein ROR55_02940 [Devosia sp.]